MNIIELAEQAEFSGREILIAHDNFARFAALVAAHEREECAKLCDEVGEESTSQWPNRLANMIRARGRA